MVEMYCEESKKKVSMACLSFIKCRGKTMFIASIFYHLGMPQHTSPFLEFNITADGMRCYPLNVDVKN